MCSLIADWQCGFGMLFWIDPVGGWIPVAGKAHRNQIGRKKSLFPTSSGGLQKDDGVTACNGNPFAPLVGCDPINCLVLDDKCPIVDNQMVAAARGEVPVSCNIPIAASLGSAVTLEPSVPLDPGDVVVQQAPHKAWKVDISTVLSSSHKMNRVEREDMGCCQEPAKKVKPVSALVQTPSDCSSLLPNLETQNYRHQLLQEAQSSSQAGLVVCNGCESNPDLLSLDVDLVLTPESINEKTVGDEVALPSDQVLVAEVPVDASSAHVEPSGMGLVLCSSAAELAKAAVGPKGTSSGMEAPGAPPGSLLKGTSEEISSVAIISFTSVEGSSDLPELLAERDSDLSPCHQAIIPDNQIERSPDVQELQCGPPVELTCKAPGAAPGNIPVVLSSEAKMHVNLEPGDDDHTVSSADDAGKNWATDSDSEDDSSLYAKEWNAEEVEVGYQWKLERGENNGNIEKSVSQCKSSSEFRPTGRLLPLPSAVYVHPDSEDYKLKQGSSCSTMPNDPSSSPLKHDGELCIVQWYNVKLAGNPTYPSAAFFFFENPVAEAGINSHVGHVAELYQDTLFPNQQGGNLEINQGICCPVANGDCWLKASVGWRLWKMVVVLGLAGMGVQQ
ncbi:hypothetical protein Nepgr_027278 [Nepenthes gracilis]|uniref:Uncharacterized protein n=1 Tax=Nepenthes gracilis TaxID=150966 RepID=A0AAD3T9M3_NEPGR|nr:hypothetical protein Nepgr_027278 [Nepenthes gracilis]